jgi:hypothetical protein
MTNLGDARSEKKGKGQWISIVLLGKQMQAADLNNQSIPGHGPNVIVTDGVILDHVATIEQRAGESARGVQTPSFCTINIRGCP